MHRPEKPHWRTLARGRFLGSTALVAVADPAPGLCECAVCCPDEYISTSTIERPREPTDGDLKAYLDRLPRTQWSHADVMLRVAFKHIGRDRAVAYAKRWLRDALLAV